MSYGSCWTKSETHWSWVDRRATELCTSGVLERRIRPLVHTDRRGTGPRSAIVVPCGGLLLVQLVVRAAALVTVTSRRNQQGKSDTATGYQE